jgi:hypothetical protein
MSWVLHPLRQLLAQRIGIHNRIFTHSVILSEAKNPEEPGIWKIADKFLARNLRQSCFY